MSARLRQRFHTGEADPLPAAGDDRHAAFEIEAIQIHGPAASTAMSSAHPVAAVDVERLRDDVIAVRRGEEHGGAGMVLRQSHPSERHRFADQPLLLAKRPMFVFGEQGVDLGPHRRVDDPRRDAVDVDAVLDEVESRRLSEADDCSFGGAVDRHQRFAAPARLRGHVDDLAALPTRNHALGDHLKSEEKTLDVDGKNLVVARLGDIDDSGHVEDTGVVDEDVDAAPALNDALDRSLDRSRLGDIERDSEGFVPMAHGGLLALAREISATATRAPSVTYRSAIAAPMPRAPPVTSAILFSSFIAALPLSSSSDRCPASANR